MDFIGIDLGTSAVKLLLMSEEGIVKRIVSRTYPLSIPRPGWSEQNPSDWYEKTLQALTGLMEGMDPAQVGGISFSGQMHGLVALDKNDRIIRPAILWNDGRTEKETDYLNETIGRENLIQYTSNIAFAGFTAPKLLWLRENEPENFARIDKIMLPKDYLVYRFTGIHATDYSDAAGTLLLDVPGKTWSAPMLDICQLADRCLPSLYESFDVVGTLTETAAKETGLLAGTPVIAGAADNAAAAIGTGTVGNNRCNLSLGTSGTVFISGNSFEADANVPIHYFVHADGGFHLLGCMLSAASCNQWWCEDILGTTDFDREADGITGLGDNPVYFLPYLMGERSPHNDPNVRGMFLGMSRDTGRSDMLQAIMEGVSFGLKDCLEAAGRLGASITEATICGGGAKSDLWLNILANVLDLPLTTIKGEEGPGYGAAILAAVGTGAFSSVSEATDRLIHYDETIAPDASIAEKYKTCYQRYTTLYPAIRDLF